MIAEHIHYTYLRNGYAEQIWTLCHTGTYQQTTIRATYDSYFIFVSILIINKVFGSCDEIVEYILFLHLRTGYVPVFTILATTTQINLCIDTSILQERNTWCRETRIKADIETAVTIEIHRILTVFLKIFLISQEHRYLCAVLAGVEYLLRYKFIGVEVNLRSTEELIGIRIHIIFIRSTGDGERSKTEETFFVIFVATETYGTERRQLNFLYFLAVQAIYIRMIGSIFIIRQE